MFLGLLLAQVDDFNKTFGSVSPPPGVDIYNVTAGGSDKIGIILFISRAIRAATIVAGIWVLFNFISAGYLFITASSESSTPNKVKEQLQYSVMGLVVIVASYTVIAVLSFVLFGKVDFILNPGLYITGPTP